MLTNAKQLRAANEANTHADLCLPQSWQIYYSKQKPRIRIIDWTVRWAVLQHTL